jgi:SAM-dependent methyltransferase
VSLRESWDAQAEEWAQFTRTPGHDHAHDRVNFPPFLDLLPAPGRRTLDIGCGEGRVGHELQRLGHNVVGVDSSPRMVELASELHEAVLADAVALPFEDGAFDLVVAYMSLMNMDDMPAATREAARVLEPGGRICISVLHPIAAAGSFADTSDPESTFVIERYFDKPPNMWVSDRGGITVTFHDPCIPFDTYARALEEADLLIETLREIPFEQRRRIPLFLHLRAVKS